MNNKKLIDYHAHLSDSKIYDNLDSIISNCVDENIGIINVGSGKIDNEKTLEISRKYKLDCCLGIHPSEIDSSNILELDKLIENNLDIVVGIGECGLDLYWRDDNLEKQKHFLNEQVKLAIKYNLPLVVHARSAYIHAYNLLMQYRGKIRGVFHCYDGDLELAEKIINDLGFYIGISGIVTFKNAKNVQDIAKNIDINYLLVETDSPYLTPNPFRGKINTPLNVLYTALEVSKLRNMDSNELFLQTVKNTQKLFKRKN